MNRLLGLCFVLFISLALLLPGCKTASPTPDAPASHWTLNAPDSRPPAVDFNLESRDGSMKTLADYKGKVVWMTFWASWCAPCRNELKLLKPLHEKYKDQGFSVVAINVDGADEKAKAKSMFLAFRAGYPLLFDSDTRLAQQYSPSIEIPFGLLIDREGRQVVFHRGFVPNDLPALEEAIAKELQRP